MKSFVLFSVLLFASASYAAPRIESNHRWALVSSGDGRMNLIDLNPIEVEPEPSFNADNDVFFVLFTRRNPTAGQRLSFNAANVRNTNWNSNAPGTRFIIHGFNNDHQSPVNVDITRAFLARADHNVVAVDWGVGANTINYLSARNRVPEVAAVVARFIDFLHQNSLLDNFSRVMIAGHSLGAHIAGLTGKRVTRGQVQAIFGLDPAGPLFSINLPSQRFAAGDAVYTEMIATNAGTLGFDQPLATANFYPNWGSAQPGCLVDAAGTCSHGRAVSFYAESINSNRFNSRRCANFGQITSQNCPTGQGSGMMGGDATKLLSGVFFLETNSRSPFARG